jgi:predicted aspartyl protease
MTKLIIPNLKEKKMGQVIATITITNRIDKVLHERGFITSEEVRSLTVNNALVDTGATMLCLPASTVGQLGLTLGGETNIETTAGLKKARIFRDVELTISGRQGTFDCVELTEVSFPLLGVTPMEILGLEPDLVSQTLRLLPMNSEQSYLMA